jgi:GNAT superfamily N-acetyltransferase
VTELQLHWADVNHCEASRLAFGLAPGAEVHERDGLVLTHCGFRVRQFNVAFAVRPLADPQAALAAAEAFYAERELPCTVAFREGLDPAGEDAARARGWRRQRAVPAMTLAPLPGAPAAPGELEIRRVESAAQLAAFQEVAGGAFGIPTAFAARYLNGDFLRHPAVACFVGSLDGVPASTAALVRTGSVAGIYWVATREDLRGRGYGEALTWRAVQAGAEQGCELASLQASELGRPVYERMGFRTTASYVHYQPPRS